MDDLDKQQDSTEVKQYKKVFTFSRNAPQESAKISYSFPVNIPSRQGAPQQPSVIGQQGQAPAVQEGSNPQASEIATPPQPPEIAAQVSPQITQSRSLDVNLPPPDSEAKKGDSLPDGRLPSPQGSLPQYPKVYVTALREKLSYMVSFQMKVASLAKQLKNLMEKPAKSPSGRPGSVSKKKEGKKNSSEAHNKLHE